MNGTAFLAVIEALKRLGKKTLFSCQRKTQEKHRICYEDRKIYMYTIVILFR